MNQKLKILHLEDMVTDVELVSRELKINNIDFEHVVIDSEQDYIAALENFGPDLILCDHSLPSFNSLEALKLIKKRNINIPFILITATMSEEVAAEVVKEGADDYILKDRLKRLPYAVLNAVEKYKFERERRELIQDAQKKDTVAREEIIKLANKLSLATKASGVGVWEYIIEEDRFTWDEQMFKIYGVPPDSGDFGFDQWQQFIHPGDCVRLVNELKAAIDSETASTTDFSIFRPDGTTRNIKAHALVKRDAGGKPLMVIGTNMDITETITNERKLLNTAQKLEGALATLENLMESSLDVICSIDGEGRFVTVSAASETVWGYKPEELVGSKYIDLVFKQDMEPTLDAAAKIIDGTKVIDFENRYLRKDGHIVHILWSANWNPESQLMFCVAKDVTEKRNFDRAMKKERDRFYEMFAEAPASIGAFHGPEHIIQMANRHYLGLTGREDIIGKTVREVFPEVEGQGLFEILDRVFTTGKPYFGKERLVQVVHKDTGSLRGIYLNFVYQPYRNTRNKIEGIFFFAIDVTEEVLLRKKVEQSEARFRALVENSYSAIVTRDGNLTITYRSPFAEHIFGYKDEERLGRKFQDAIHEDDRALVEIHEKTVLKNPGKSLPVIFRAKHKSGKYIWVEEITCNLLNDPSVSAIVSNLRDITLRRNFEEQQSLLAAIVNSSDDAIMSFSTDGIITSWNLGAEKLYYYDESEALGMPINMLIPPYRQYEEGEIITKILAAEHIDHYETERIRKDGTIVEVSLTVSPIIDGDGEVTAASKIARDITKIKRSEELIKKSEKQYRQLIEVLPAAIYTCDPEGKILLYNNAATALWGRTPTVGKDKWCGAWKMFDKEGNTLPFEKSPMAVSIKTGKQLRGDEIIIERPDGSRRHVLPHPSPMYGPAGLIGALNMLLDVTEIREYENALKGSEKQFRQIVETAQEGIWLFDENNKTVFVNTKLCDILGYPKEEMMGNYIYEYMDDEGKAQVIDGNGSAVGISGAADFGFISKKGYHIWTNVSANSIFDDNGAYKGSLAMVTDITEKIVLQQNLLEEQVKRQKQITKAEITAQEKERTELARELHDNVNQILAASKLYLNYSLNEKQNYQAYVSKSQGYISNAIEEIRKLTKSLSGPSSDKTVGLITTVDALVNDLRAVMNEIKFEFIYGDYTEEDAGSDRKLVIFRIIQEQLNNIMKHARATEVEIELKNNDEGTRLRISDNGKGFDTSLPRQGIGISNIINRAELYNGSVEIFSSPGHGCRLEVSIPTIN